MSVPGTILRLFRLVMETYPTLIRLGTCNGIGR